MRDSRTKLRQDMTDQAARLAADYGMRFDNVGALLDRLAKQIDTVHAEARRGRVETKQDLRNELRHIQNDVEQLQNEITSCRTTVRALKEAMTRWNAELAAGHLDAESLEEAAAF